MILTLSLVISFPRTSQATAIYNAITLVDLRIIGATNSSGPLGSKPNDLLFSGDAFGTADVADAVPNTPVPEPSTFALMIIGLIGMVFMVRRNRLADAELGTSRISSKN